MRQSSLIKDPQIREIIDRLEKRMDRIEDIQQLPTDASNEDIVKVINKITNSIKRRRNI